MNNSVQNDRPTLRNLAAKLVVLALVIFATTQVVHTHALSSANGPNPIESHCSLCIAAHSVAAPAQVNTITTVFASVIFQAAAEPQLHSRLAVLSAFIRPPPASL
jgi:hypothetical protein